MEPVPSGKYIIFGDHSEHIKYVDFPFIQGADGLKILQVKAKDILTKYIYYAFLNFYKRENTYKRHWLTAKEVIIPIPPMRVQTEIVRILDEYTEKYEALKFELSAELELRKKQYYYYREKLLKFTNDTAVFVALSEVATIYGGLSGKRKEDFENGNAYYITYKNIFSNISVDLSILEKVQISEGEKQHKVKKGDVLFTGSSENLEDVAISSVLTKNFEEDIFLNSFSFGLRFNENIAILPDFAKFLFRSEHIRSQLKKTANGVTRYNVSKEKINRIIIPIPPIEEQERIVSILDKFDSLVNSLSEGLPAEINLRQKQYEYYRNALLSFE